MARRRFWWRRRPWQPSRRCSWCGWATPDPFDGRVYGLHDKRYVGHGAGCPIGLAGYITTPRQLADQWLLVELWAAVVAPLGDWCDWQEAFGDWSRALAGRADMLGCDLPVEDRIPAPSGV